MNSSYPLIARIISIVLMLIGVIMWIIVAYTADDQNEGIVDAFVTYGKWMVVIGFILALFSFIWSLVINPDSIKSVVIGLVVVLVVGGLSYVLADGSDFEMYKNTDESTSKMVSTGLNSFYIIGLLAVLSVVYSGVAKIFK